MAVPPQPTDQLPSSNAMRGEVDEEKIYNGYRSFIQALPLVERISFKQPLRRHPNQWYCGEKMMVGAPAVADHFKSRPSDILLASHPRSGTTWLKALLFLTVNRRIDPVLLRDGDGDDDHPFATANPHKLVPFLDLQLYIDHIPDLDVIPPPRLYASHIPYQSLPESTKASGCRIVYLCRNPLDTLVSSYHFLEKILYGFYFESFTLSNFFEDFINGFTTYGPFWDHVLGYWNASKTMPQTVLFLKYEEMRKEPEIQLKKLAEFIGCPFTEEEEIEGVVAKILRFSSFKHLSNMEANKSGVTWCGDVMLENTSFFRKGEVGDWKNYLTQEMVERLRDITKEKFQGTGLDFQIS